MSTLLIAVGLVALLTIWVLFGAPRKPRRDNGKMPPFIPGVPVLGTMLQYNKDPKKFVTENGSKFGVFTIDLAGRDAVLLTDRKALEQYYAAPESKLSAVAAMKEMNFDALLSELNIEKGTNIHRKILMRELRTNVLDQLLENFKSSCLSALPRVLSGSERVDLFGAIRKVFMYCIIETFMGKEVLEDYPEFVVEYYKWHDIMEEAAALSVILPKFIARPAIFWTVGKWRNTIVAKLQNSIQRIWNAKSSRYMEEIKEVDHNSTAEEATNYMIGILFAAHKNPAITASQVVSFLLENPSVMKRVKAEIDENLRGTKIESITVAQLQNDFPVLLAAVWETLRLCSHSLGSVRIVQQEQFTFKDSQDREYTLPEGTLIASSPISLSMDGKMFTDSRNFDIDRLLPPRSENGKHTIAFAPFSSGTHGCPGRPFALLMVQYCVLALLSKYDITAAKLPLPDLDFHKATIAQRSKPVLVDWRAKGN